MSRKRTTSKVLKVEESATGFPAFIERKLQLDGSFGFEPTFLPDFLFDFQKHLVTWNTRQGRSATFADCGMGKTPMELVWAQNVVEHTNKPVLIAAPLSVANQTVREGEKFGIECRISRDGKHKGGIVVTNYEKLHLFDSNEFAGMAADESGILKHYESKTKGAIIEFMRRLPYRLLCTATASPNDYIELGNSSEALGVMGYMDMLSRFFKADNGAMAQGGGGGGRFSKNPFGSKFRFRGHAERDFWRWVCSWARAITKPSDLGFPDGDFILPELITRQHQVESTHVAEGFLFPTVAVGLKEQRQERRHTLRERCEMAAALINPTHKPAIAWSNLNDEGDLLEELIPDAVQVSGADSDQAKEEKIEAFITGQARVMVSKIQVTGFGMNFQHCAHQTYFPSHSFEEWYQGIRRSWRFGQKNPVTIDVITSDGEAKVLANLQRKAAQAQVMFSQLVALMGDQLNISKDDLFTNKQTNPSWL